MRTFAVIGKCFGDEGKGLATDYFSSFPGKTIAVRHNGGSQSAHTVEQKGEGGKRFVFHALSSGSVRHADTLWIAGFYPDLYKLRAEIESFSAAFGYVPKILSEDSVGITVPDDVLINMALEASRGGQRHGSCGMGINECDLRTNAGFGISLSDLTDMNADDLYRRLSIIRRDWTVRRLREISEELTSEASDYIGLLSDDNILRNAAAEITQNIHYISVLSESGLIALLENTDTLIFESGQGLLLDRNNTEYAPHVTASDTGLKRPCAFLRRMGYVLDEAVYVSRTYVTRHGAGTLYFECDRTALGNVCEDRTNEPNPWQGAMRFARHGSAEDFIRAVAKDLSAHRPDVRKVSLFLTHLNETDRCVLLNDRSMPAEAFIHLPQIAETFHTVYLSDTHYAEDVKAVRI